MGDDCRPSFNAQAPLERRIRELTDEVRQLSGKPKLNLGSSKEVGDVLFGVLKLPVPHCATKGASKNPSTNNEVALWQFPCLRTSVVAKNSLTPFVQCELAVDRSHCCVSVLQVCAGLYSAVAVQGY